MRGRRLFVLIPVLAVALILGAVPLWGHVRESRADGLAVKYGAAPSKEEATLADRCTGVMREDYNTMDFPGKAGIGAKTVAVLVPQICALGVERGLVADDGTMTEKSGYDLTKAVAERMGPERFQTLNFNELAVSQYHLAKPGHVTRWHRCVAMMYSAWDAQASKTTLPPRELWRRTSHEACTAGIERGIVPQSGSPAPETVAGREFRQLMVSMVLKQRERCAVPRPRSCPA
jgi:hypothetical protein